MNTLKNSIFEIKQISYNDYYISINEKNDINKNILFESLIKTKLLFPGIIENKELYFKAVNVEYLNKNHIKTEYDYINLMESISTQIFYLEKKGYTFYGFNLSDIIVIDKNIYIILNSYYIKKINNITKNILFDMPFKKPYFCSPEIYNIIKIPQEISYKSIYYSIGALIVYLRFDIYLFENEKLMTEDNIKEIISKIKYTNLYWFLKRCFEKIEDRYLIYI